MRETLKGRLPWRLGATSYVTPGDILSNVRLLAPLVDDIQLLFFESSQNERLTQAVPQRELQRLALEHRLTYTCHLPTDIRLGADDSLVRRQAVEEIIFRMESLAVLDIVSFDLHLRQEMIPQDCWLANLAASLALLASRLGSAVNRVAIENIDYPLALILPLIRAHGFSLCLDLGHVTHYGHDRAEAVGLIAAARHIHWHGVRNGRDHQALTADVDSWAGLLAGKLAALHFQGVVTLEMYDIKLLRESLDFLATAWDDFLDNTRRGIVK